MNGFTLDAGALIAIERNDRVATALLRRALDRGLAIAVPTGVIGQVWRDGRRQARLASFLASADLEIEPLDDKSARHAGQLCGRAGTADVIDASVVLCARARDHAVVTSDVGDIRRLDRRIAIIPL